MAGRGPAPKPSQERMRRNLDHRRVVPAVGPSEVPLLRGRWPKAVHEWYETWASSPQANQFLPTDWQRLRMLAPLVQQYFAEPSVKLASELRQQESLLGATMLDRMRLRIDVQEAEKSRPVVRQRLVVVDEASA